MRSPRSGAMRFPIFISFQRQRGATRKGGSSINRPRGNGLYSHASSSTISGDISPLQSNQVVLVWHAQSPSPAVPLPVRHALKRIGAFAPSNPPLPHQWRDAATELYTSSHPLSAHADKEPTDALQGRQPKSALCFTPF